MISVLESSTTTRNIWRSLPHDRGEWVLGSLCEPGVSVSEFLEAFPDADMAAGAVLYRYFFIISPSHSSALGFAPTASVKFRQHFLIGTRLSIFHRRGETIKQQKASSQGTSRQSFPDLLCFDSFNVDTPVKQHLFLPFGNILVPKFLSWSQSSWPSLGSRNELVRCPRRIWSYQ